MSDNIHITEFRYDEIILNLSEFKSAEMVFRYCFKVIKLLTKLVEMIGPKAKLETY